MSLLNAQDGGNNNAGMSIQKSHSTIGQRLLKHGIVHMAVLHDWSQTQDSVDDGLLKLKIIQTG